MTQNGEVEPLDVLGRRKSIFLGSRVERVEKQPPFPMTPICARARAQVKRLFEKGSLSQLSQLTRRFGPLMGSAPNRRDAWRVPDGVAVSCINPADGGIVAKLARRRNSLPDDSLTAAHPSAVNAMGRSLPLICPFCNGNCRTTFANWCRCTSCGVEMRIEQTLEHRHAK